MDDRQPEHLPVPDLPKWAVKLARRAAGLRSGNQARRVVFEVIYTENGEQLLIVDGGPKVENLGK